MTKVLKIMVLVLLVSFLILIRMFESELFYDPLISFFKTDYNNNPLPTFNSVKLLGNVALRFIMNTVISLAILWTVFKDKGIIKLTGFLYVVFFIILMIAFYYLLVYSDSKNFLPLFYVRRFLIQPLFLLVLLPAFYFQKKR